MKDQLKNALDDITLNTAKAKSIISNLTGDDKELLNNIMDSMECSINLLSNINNTQQKMMECLEKINNRDKEIIKLQQKLIDEAKEIFENLKDI